MILHEITVPTPSTSPVYGKSLDIMACATVRLNLKWWIWKAISANSLACVFTCSDTSHSRRYPYYIYTWQAKSSHTGQGNSSAHTIVVLWRWLWVLICRISTEPRKPVIIPWEDFPSACTHTQTQRERENSPWRPH